VNDINGIIEFRDVSGWYTFTTALCTVEASVEIMTHATFLTEAHV